MTVIALSARKTLCVPSLAEGLIGGWARSPGTCWRCSPAFLLACLAVAALPGPSTALFLHRTVRDGRAAGLAAVAGNEIGVFCWALAAGAGLTGLLRANRWLYLALHVVGAVVLVYLGVSGVAQRAAPTRPGRDPGSARHRPGRRVPLSRPGRAQRDAGGCRRVTAAADCRSVLVVVKPPSQDHSIVDR